jgi:hypothetical protein
VVLDKGGFAAGTPGLGKDPKGPVDAVLADAGLNLGVESKGIPTRRLTAAQVQKALVFHHQAQDFTLDDDSTFTFEHDPANGEFDPCTDSCKVLGPVFTRRVGVTDGTIGGIKFHHLLFFFAGGGIRIKDKGEFIKDGISWAPMSLQASGGPGSHTGLDQRHLVGLTRLCKRMSSVHGLKALYSQGVMGDLSRTDCHGHGTALDLGGFSTELPDPATVTTNAKTMATATKAPIRLGTDFIVLIHWGMVGPWDPAKVATETDKTKWTRVASDATDYSTANPAQKKLAYRLDPLPFQDPVPAGTKDKDKLDLVAPHFAVAGPLFKSIFDFICTEFSDTNEALGPVSAELSKAVGDGEVTLPLMNADPPLSKWPRRGKVKVGDELADYTVLNASTQVMTIAKGLTNAQGETSTVQLVEAPTAIDDRSGHFILHPDYGTPNSLKSPPPTDPKEAKDNKDGRQAHVNHYHLQVGPTQLGKARTD